MEFFAYHVVTNQPMQLGQKLCFDEDHPNGVYRRVMEKAALVAEISAHPENYTRKTLEHHTAVALRELALEAVRKERYPMYPSRMRCLYVSDSLEEAEKWFSWFIDWGRPTYQIVRLKIQGRCFVGDANNCFPGSPDREENLHLAAHYWENLPNAGQEPPIWEMLVDGDIEVMEIVKEKTPSER